ncbi:gamma-glutamyltransferase [Sphingosinicella sp. BN140058]|uniref:gamma-glutamyltransferase n=1 Tax=Sphingosinicella sp. BN140058 TaxID=1892855 RepID=UPI001010C910|nr:gamma-glutamyltransferase [Sphingosinicella sp. BN140058]QAY76971.1 gamma-glutamyltransferase [Sphingosinicella sp. BN140058]
MLRHFILPFSALLASCAAVPAVDSGAVPASAAATVPVAPRPGMVSAADPRAAEAGREILNAGGSAADAALAMMLALTVVEPQSSGIGGGGFFVYHDETSGGMSTIDGREEAPAAAGSNWFYTAAGQPLPYRQAIPGGRSVGVPGNIRLMARAHEAHGKLPWAKLFEPAIRLARDGFVITPRFARTLAANADLAASTPSGRGLFYDADGTAKPAGTTVRNPELARFLTELASRGPEWFYTGPNAQAIVSAVNGAARNPSQMKVGDIASYEAKARDPVCGTYRQYRICGMGPPSSGGTTVFAILKQLERFDIAKLGPNDPEAWHLIGDSMRLAYADREAYVGDPDNVRVPVEGMIDPAYLKARSALIQPGKALAHVTAGTPRGAPKVASVRDGEVPATTHFVAVDGAGNVANMTSTIEGPFGSGLMANGYFLNNELTDFNIVPDLNGVATANRVEPGKRPRSSMAPTIVYGPDGEVRIAIGAAGGVTIIAQVAKALIAVLDWNMSAQDAIALPVMIGLEDQLRLERGGTLEAMAPALRAMGHQVAVVSPGFKANAIERIDGHWAGAADPRSEGVALGQ